MAKKAHFHWVFGPFIAVCNHFFVYWAFDTENAQNVNEYRPFSAHCINMHNALRASKTALTYSWVIWGVRIVIRLSEGSGGKLHFSGANSTFWGILPI